MTEPLPEIVVWHWPQDEQLARDVAEWIDAGRHPHILRIGEETKRAVLAEASFPPGALLITQAPLKEG